jgi:hypothetical protein
VLLLTLAGLFFARTLKRNSYADWGLWVLLSVLAVYSQFMAAVTLSAYAVSLLFVRARDVPWKRMAVGWAGIGIAVSPLIYHALRRGTGPIAWIQPPGRPDLYKLLRFLTGAGGKWLLLLYACFIIVAVASLRQGGGARRRRFDGWAVWFLFTWLLLPIFLVLAISLKQPLLVPRYLIGCLPPLVLLAAIGVEQVHPTALRVAAVSVIVALALSAVLEYYRGLSQYYKDDWRSATNYLLDNTRRGDTVLIYRAYGRLPLAYYLRQRPAPFNVIPVRGGGDTALLASISYSRVWLVLCHCHSDAEGRRLESVVAGHSTPTEEVRFPGLRVVLFEQGGVPAELSGCADKPRDQ